jgi:tetratricopeptide (TPR) repeat protein
MAQSAENEMDDTKALDAAGMSVNISERQYGPYLLTLARVHEKQKQWESAIQIYEECLILAKQLDDPSTAQRIQELIANIRLLNSQP